MPCEGHCTGYYPYSCDLNQKIGYCGKTASACLYHHTTNPFYCCYKGCESEQSLNLTTIPSITQSLTLSLITDNRHKCEGKCRGSYPFGCSANQQYGYCNNKGDFYYQSTNDPNLASFIKEMCCFKGCSENEIVQTTIESITQTQVSMQITTIDNKAKCDGKCKGYYPYGCSTSHQYGNCNLKGDCYYQSTNDPNLASFIREMCCFKGC
jgi:hypothetical protein